MGPREPLAPAHPDPPTRLRSRAVRESARPALVALAARCKPSRQPDTDRDSLPNCPSPRDGDGETHDGFDERPLKTYRSHHALHFVPADADQASSLPVVIDVNSPFSRTR